MPQDADADELFARLLGDRDVIHFLAADFARIQSAENRALLYGLLAQVLLEGEAKDWSTLSLRCPYSPSEIIQHASEVEPKTYAPDERLQQPSQVLRGVARVINFLRAKRLSDACEVTERIDWPAVRQTVAYGVLRYGGISGKIDRTTRKRLEAALDDSESSGS